MIAPFFPGRADQPPVSGLDVVAEGGGRQHGAHLHAQILGVAHHVDAAVQIVRHDGQVELRQRFDQLVQQRLLVHHVVEQVFVAAQVAQLQKGVAVPQTADVQGLRRGGDLLLQRAPVDGADAGAAVGIGQPIGAEGLPVGQRMAGDGAGDAVAGGGPDAAEIVPVRGVLARHQVVGGLKGERRLAESRKQQRVRFHQLKQRVLRISVIAGGVDVKGHRDVVGTLKADGPQVVFLDGHRGVSFLHCEGGQMPRSAQSSGYISFLVFGFIIHKCPINATETCFGGVPSALTGGRIGRMIKAMEWMNRTDRKLSGG